MGEISMIGLDIAKNVFHVHGVASSGAVVLRRQLRRGQVEKFFAQLPPTLVPRHRGFDRLDVGFQEWQVLGRHEDFDAARDPGLSADEASAFEGENHLVDGWRGDAEVVLHLMFGGWSPMDPGVGVDEGQILSLLGRKAGLWSARHLIHLSIRLGLHPGGCDECTPSCRIDGI